MVSTGNIILGGLALVLLGVGATSLFRSNGLIAIPQSTMEDPPIQPQQPSLFQQITNQINKLTKELKIPKPQTQFQRRIRMQSQRKVFSAPPQSLTDFQILGVRRRVQGNIVAGRPSAHLDVGVASRLLSTERLAQNLQITAIREQKIDILGQLKDLRMTINDSV